MLAQFLMMMIRRSWVTRPWVRLMLHRTRDPRHIGALGAPRHPGLLLLGTTWWVLKLMILLDRLWTGYMTWFWKWLQGLWPLCSVSLEAITLLLAKFVVCRCPIRPL